MEHFEDGSVNNVDTDDNNDTINNTTSNPVAEKSKNFDYLETVSLLNIWSRTEIQDSFKSNKKGHNKVWQNISQLLLENNQYSRSYLQCKNRVENLRRKYYELKKLPSGSGGNSWPYYTLFNKVLGTTAIVDPVSIVDSLDPTSATSASTTANNTIRDDIDETRSAEEGIGDNDENTPSIRSRPAKRKRRNNYTIDEDMLQILKKSQEDEEVYRKESKLQDQAILDVMKGLLTGINSLVSLEKEKVDMKKNERYTLYGAE